MRWVRFFVKIVVFLTILLVVLAIGGYFGLRYYLSSESVAAQVAAKLEKILGGRVKVGNVEIGITGGSTVRNLELFEKGEKTKRPWLKVDKMTADVNVFDVQEGKATPKHIALTGAHLSFNWDKNGKFSTNIPNPETGGKEAEVVLPRIELKESQIVFHKEGDDATVLKGLNGHIEGNGKLIKLRAKINDPVWGKWEVEGTYQTDTQTAELSLQTVEAVSVTRKQLQALPFIPTEVWDEVQVDGQTTGTVQLGYCFKNQDFQYQLDLEPSGANLHIGRIELDAAETKGKVTIQNGVVKLNKISGSAYGGKLQGVGTVDYTKPELRVEFKEIRAEKLHVQKLPKSWNLPKQFDGKLSARLSLLFDQSHKTAPLLGEGQGLIEEATLGGQKVQELTLKMKVTEKGMRWKQMEEEGGEQQAAGVAPKLEFVSVQTSQGVQGKPESDATIWWLHAPAWAANFTVRQLVRGTEASVDAVGHIVNTVTRQAGKIKPPSTLEINLKMNDVDLAQFLQKLKVEVPFEVKGRLSFHIQAGIPTNSSGDPKTYTALGNATIRDFHLAGLYFEEITAAVRYTDGVLTLRRFQARLPSPDKGAKPGLLDGFGRLALFPAGKLTARVIAKDVAAGLLQPLIQGRSDLQGLLSGKLDAAVAAEDIRDVSAWQIVGQVASKKLSSYGLSFKQGFLQLQLLKSVLTVSDLQGILEGSPISGSAKLTLAKSFPFEGQLQLLKGDLQILQKLPADVRPALKVTGTVESRTFVKGDLLPLRVKLKGTVQAAKVVAANFAVDKVKFDWNSDTAMLHLRNISADAYKGKILGRADLPMLPKRAGVLQFKLKQLDVTKLSKDQKFPVSLAGKIDGVLTGKIPQVKGKQQRDSTYHLDVMAPNMLVQGFPTSKFKGHIDFIKEMAHYKLSAFVFGREMKFKGKLPLQEKPAKKGIGKVQIDNVALADIWRAFAPGARRVPLTGKVHFQMTYEHEPNSGWPIGNGNLSLTKVQWQGKELADKITTPVWLKDGQVQLKSIKGQLARGRVTGNLHLNLLKPTGSTFQLTVEQMNAAQFQDTFLASVKGPLSLSLRGIYQHQWSGSGEVRLFRGSVAGLAVQNVRLPLRWRVDASTRGTLVDVVQGAGQVARGRVHGHATLKLGPTLDLQGSVKAVDVVLPELLRQTNMAHHIGGGRVTGELQFAGRNLRSLADLKASLTAKFGRNRALAFPSLRRITSLLHVSPTIVFSHGELQARLEKGRVHIDQLELESALAQLAVQGIASLDGRLNLNVIAHVGPLGTDAERLRRLGHGVPFPDSVPVNVVSRAGQLLTQRLFVIQVIGHYRNPVMRLRPRSTLRQEAQRLHLLWTQ